MSNPKANRPDAGDPTETPKVELVVETIKVSSTDEFDRRIKLFYDTYTDVKVLGYSVDHTKKSYKRTYVMTLQGMKYSNPTIF